MYATISEIHSTKVIAYTTDPTPGSLEEIELDIDISRILSINKVKINK